MTFQRLLLLVFLGLTIYATLIESSDYGGSSLESLLEKTNRDKSSGGSHGQGQIAGSNSKEKGHGDGDNTGLHQPKITVDQKERGRKKLDHKRHDDKSGLDGQGRNADSNNNKKTRKH